jgi:hypothetical protein
VFGSVFRVDRAHSNDTLHKRSNNNMFKSIWNIASAAFLLYGSTTVVHAYSSGAGQCIGGTAAVGEPHMASTAVTGSLQDGALTVTVLRDQTDAPSEEITTNTDTTITIGFSSSDSTGFRGALIRASSTDGAEFTLEPGINGANARWRAPKTVYLVSHTSPMISRWNWVPYSMSPPLAQ